MNTVQHYKSKFLNVDWYKNFLTTNEIHELTTYFSQHKKDNSFKTYKRMNTTFGDGGGEYTIKFKNKTVTRKAVDWADIPILQKLKSKLQKIVGGEFNFCVFQNYPSGKYGIRPHRDKEMISGTKIVGVSFGETRVLRLQRYDSIINLTLTPGSVYVLNPPTNDYYTHSIVTDNTTKPRMSLTFRNYTLKKSIPEYESPEFYKWVWDVITGSDFIDGEQYKKYYSKLK